MRLTMSAPLTGLDFLLTIWWAMLPVEAFAPPSMAVNPSARRIEPCRQFRTRWVRCSCCVIHSSEFSHRSVYSFYRNDSSTSVSSISRTTLSSIQLLQLNMAPIGFVGLGIMGEGMAARLLSQGVAGMDDETPLVVWNRTGSKCTALVEKFPDKKIIIKSTAREVVETCGVTYSMLSTPEASKIVFEGEDGVLAGVAAGKSIVDCATLAEADMQRMNQQVTEKGG